MHFSNMQEFWQWVLAIGSVGFLIAIYFSFKLSNETRHERYWVLFSLSALFFALHYWLMLAEIRGLLSTGALLAGQALSGLIGAALFGYASYGLYRAMVKVRLQMEKL